MKTLMIRLNFNAFVCLALLLTQATAGSALDYASQTAARTSYAASFIQPGKISDPKIAAARLYSASRYSDRPNTR